MKYAVLGAGCGGQTFAGHLASMGFEVNLYNRSRARLGDLPKKPIIKLQGAIEGEGRLQYASTNIAPVIKDADTILVATTALGHRDIARYATPHLKDGQTIILNPSRTFGALEVANTIYSKRPELDITICEANTLLYATRVPKPGTARVHGVKDEVTIAAIRAERTNKVVEKLQKAFPQIKAAESILETSLGNIGAVFHPAIFLSNYERIQTKEDFEFYREGVTDKALESMKLVDAERQQLARSLGATIPTLEEWLRTRYDLEGKDLKELLHNNPVYAGIAAPKEIQHRYLLEDVPTGLVPLALVGDALGVETPTMQTLIKEAEKITGHNLYESGRTLERLGLTRENLQKELEGIITSNIRSTG